MEKFFQFDTYVKLLASFEPYVKQIPLTYRKLCQDRRLRPIFKLPFEQDDLRSM